MSELNVQTPIEDFDWDAYEKGTTAGSKTREEVEKTYDETLKTAKDNEVVTGTVKSISKREVRVDIGMKSDAIIPVSEFRYNPDLKEGDEVEVFIETLEDKNGQLRLSHKKACQTRSWDRVNQALENDEIIKG
ncbi:MAG: S1 RNA-binding domain-containing protein, partial [Muribaculaceae bacterium]|nr:S1 RNA-binding domain-containing protein [Muribaculaceae bacterium]